MALHMLIELLMLFVAGGADGMLRHKSRRAGWRKGFDAYGLLGWHSPVASPRCG